MKIPVSLKINVIITRIIEMLIPTVVFSAIITALNVSGVVTLRFQVILMILLFTVIFMAYNVYRMRICYIETHDRKEYYFINFLAQIIFCAINFLFYYLTSNKVYAWAFSITKLLRQIDIGTCYSILFFHILGVLCIFISTIGMGWVFLSEEELEEIDPLISYIKE